MERMEFMPLESIGSIRFGMKREEVRATLGMKYKEFKKSKFSKNTADDFGYFHIFYTNENKVDAVEIFDGVEVTIGNARLFPAELKEIEKVIGNLTEDSGSYLQIDKSVGIYAPDGKVESLLVGAKGYYE